MQITSNTTTAFEQKWSGGPGRFNVSGTFDSGSAQLVYKSGGVWHSFGDNAKIEADGGCQFDANKGDELGVTTADGGGSISIFASVEPLQQIRNQPEFN